MKTILIPVDFTDISQNAVDYGTELIKISKGKMILFHSYALPTTDISSPYDIISAVPVLVPQDEIEKDCIESLNELKNKIQAGHGAIEIECICRMGFPVDEIHNVAKEFKADLIIMGIRKVGFLSEKFFGTTTTSVVNESECPVLVIPESIKFKEISKIAFACDFGELKNEFFLKSVKFLAQLFDSHIYLLNVILSDSVFPTEKQAAESLNLEQSLKGLDYSFNYIESDDIVDGVNDFADENQVDLVVMIPRSHSLIERLFHESYTKRMAFHTSKPLLTIHE